MPSIVSFTLIALNFLFVIDVKAASCPQHGLCSPGSPYPYRCTTGYYIVGGFAVPTSACLPCTADQPWRCNSCLSGDGVNACNAALIPIHCIPTWGLVGAPTDIRTHCVNCALITPGSYFSDGSKGCTLCSSAGLTCDPITGVITSCKKPLVLYNGGCISCKPIGRNPDPRCIG